jgi:hypothetical protein
MRPSSSFVRSARVLKSLGGLISYFWATVLLVLSASDMAPERLECQTSSVLYEVQKMRLIGRQKVFKCQRANGLSSQDEDICYN